MSGKQRMHPNLQWGMKTWFSFRRALVGADMEKSAHLCSLIKGCRWRWTVPGHICKNGLWGLWKQMLDFHLWAHYWISFFFFFFFVKNNDRAFKFDEHFESGPFFMVCCPLSGKKTAIQVPAQRQTSLRWNTNMSNCEVPPESCRSRKK